MGAVIANRHRADGEPYRVYFDESAFRELMVDGIITAPYQQLPEDIV